MSQVLALNETVDRCPVCAASRFTRLHEPDLCQCQRCSITFRNPRPDQQLVRACYESGETFNDWQRELDLRAHLWAKRYALIRSYRTSGSLLDVGTGDGYFLDFAKEDFAVEATEIAHTGAAYAIERGHAVHVGSIFDLEFENRQYDVITLWHVLEHMPNPGEVLKRLKQLLKRDGLLVIAVPNEAWPLFKDRFGRGHIHPFGRLVPGQEIHLIHFTPNTLRRSLEQLFGFRILEFGVDDVHIFRRKRRLPGYLASRLSSRLIGWHWDLAMLAVCTHA